jgi:hypothetical protein
MSVGKCSMHMRSAHSIPNLLRVTAEHLHLQWRYHKHQIFRSISCPISNITTHCITAVLALSPSLVLSHVTTPAHYS